MKINYKKICLLLIVLIVSGFLLTGVEAAVTSDTGNVVKDNTGAGGDILNAVMEVIGYIGGMAASGVFATITALINALSIAMFILLYTIVSGGTGDFTHLPMPDTIVFNRFAFFDPNFINPANGSLIASFQDILGNVFASFQTVAIAIFIIAAMVAGIKMALSTIASKKAIYKEAALKWVTGFLILICLKWILAGIFYANEYVIAKLYEVTTDSANLMIPVRVYEIVPIFGRLIKDLIMSFEGFTGIELADEFNIPRLFGNNIS